MKRRFLKSLTRMRSCPESLRKTRSDAYSSPNSAKKTFEPACACFRFCYWTAVQRNGSRISSTRHTFFHQRRLSPDRLFSGRSWQWHCSNGVRSASRWGSYLSSNYNTTRIEVHAPQPTFPPKQNRRLKASKGTINKWQRHTTTQTQTSLLSRQRKLPSLAMARRAMLTR